MVVLSTLINTVIIHDHYVDRLERWFLHKIVTDREVSRIIRGTEPLETERLESPLETQCEIHRFICLAESVEF
jgi:hypothetical protein